MRMRHRDASLSYAHGNKLAPLDAEPSFVSYSQRTDSRICSIIYIIHILNIYS